MTFAVRVRRLPENCELEAGTAVFFVCFCKDKRTCALNASQLS